MIYAIDARIMNYINSFATKSQLFDSIYVRATQLPLLKLLPITLCIIWVWFDSNRAGKQRIAVFQALLGTFIALVVSRLIQNLSPHRPRPLNADSLNFVLPVQLLPDEVNRWNDWSSFPSDNAALAFALATGIWCVSRPLGWACFFWAAFVVSLPRVYAGFHYPSDVVGGALLGTLSTFAVARFTSNANILKGLNALEERSRALFYSVGFTVLFCITTVFEDIRKIITRLAEAI